MKNVRIALLGAGAMGAEHGWCFSQIPGVEVAWIFSRSPEKAAAVAEPLGATPTANLDAVIGDASLDAIDVCLPTPVHADVVTAALAAGRNVFCETPLATDLGEARRMAEAARAAGKLLQVGLLMRSIAACRFVKDAAESGAFGRLLHLSADRLGSYLRAEAGDHKAHYSDPATELMTFDLDFAGWLFGRPRTVVARAAQWNGRPGEVAALLDFGDGRTATILASGIMPAAFPFTTGFRAVFEGAAMESRTVIAGGEVTSQTRLFQGAAVVEPPLAPANPYQVELERFVACIRSDADPGLLDVQRAVEALELSIAVQQCISAAA